MLPFSRLRFEVYSKDLSAALWDLRDEMGDYGFRSIIVPRYNSGRPEGRRALRVAPESEIMVARTTPADHIQRLPPMSEEATIIEPNEFRRTEQSGPGAIRAKLDALKQKAAERRAQAMAKLDGADTKLASVDIAIEQYAAKIEKEADDGLAEFAQFTNGGPV